MQIETSMSSALTTGWHLGALQAVGEDCVMITLSVWTASPPDVIDNRGQNRGYELWDKLFAPLDECLSQISLNVKIWDF